MNDLQQFELFTSGEGGVLSYRIPALTTTRSGTLIAACDARIDRKADAPNNIDLVMRRSLDHGETWSATEVIARFPGEEAACDPCILADQTTGAVWVFYDYAVPHDTLPLKRKMMVHAIRSEDDGATWSAPWDLTGQLVQPGWYYLSVAPGRGLQTADGALMIPAYSVKKDGTRSCHLVCSEDHGVSWQVRAGVGDSGGEPQAVELDDGTIMMNIRQPGPAGCRKITVSADSGRTWSETWEDKTLIDPGCQASILKVVHPGTGESSLLFTNAACTGERRNMTLRISHDEGKTWPVSQVINADRSMYSCLTQLADGRIGLLYETVTGITFACFSLGAPR